MHKKYCHFFIKVVEKGVKMVGKVKPESILIRLEKYSMPLKHFRGYLIKYLKKIQFGNNWVRYKRNSITSFYDNIVS